MRVNIIRPKWYAQMNGFNEQLQDELYTVVSSLGIEVVLTEEEIALDCQVYFLIAQYREEVVGNFIDKMCKKCPEKSCIGVFGKAARAFSETVLRKSINIDFVATSCCKELVVGILRNVECGKNMNIPGTITRDGYFPLEESGGEIIKCTSFKYLEEGKRKYPICVLSSSHICGGNCYFCERFGFSKELNKKAYKSAKDIADEIEFVIQKYGRRIFAFSDDNFIFNEKEGVERAYELADEILKRNLKIRYTFECRSDSVDLNLFNKLKKSGLYKVFVGIESGSQSFLDRLNKGITVHQNANAIECLKKIGVICEPGIILFDPLSSYNEIRDSYEFFLEYEKDLRVTFSNGDYKLFLTPNNPLIRNKYWTNQTESFYRDIVYKDYELKDNVSNEIYKKFKCALDKNSSEEGLNRILDALGFALNV